VLCVAGWLILYVCTLQVTATIVMNRFLGQASGEGYGAYVSIMGFLVIMPIGLLVSCVVLAVWRRVVVFLVLAVVIAAAAGFAPVILSCLPAQSTQC
jgi:hypothetical protein